MLTLVIGELINASHKSIAAHIEDRNAKAIQMIRSRFSVRKHRPIWPCMSNKKLPHDVVGPNTCLKMWAEGRKGKDGMAVNQEPGLDGKAENGRNLDRAIPWNHVPFKKSGEPVESLQVERIGLSILRVDIKIIIGPARQKAQALGAGRSSHQDGILWYFLWPREVVWPLFPIDSGA